MVYSMDIELSTFNSYFKANIHIGTNCSGMSSCFSAQMISRLHFAMIFLKISISRITLLSFWSKTHPCRPTLSLMMITPSSFRLLLHLIKNNIRSLSVKCPVEEELYINQDHFRRLLVYIVLLFCSIGLLKSNTFFSHENRNSNLSLVIANAIPCQIL